MAAGSPYGGRVKITSIQFCSLSAVCSIVLVLAGTGCSSPRLPAVPVPVHERSSDDVSYWDGDHMTGSPSVRINLTEQRAYLFKGDQLAGVSLISSGREGLGTVTGDFRIIQKDKAHKSSMFGDYVDASGAVIQKDVERSKDPMPAGARYDGAKMPHFMRIVDGTGMHEGLLPGYAASHGCIRMPGFMAEAFFRTVSVGTPVSILP
jgi:L,D-transpeptidase catalytic domain